MMMARATSGKSEMRSRRVTSGKLRFSSFVMGQRKRAGRARAGSRRPDDAGGGDDASADCLERAGQDEELADEAVQAAAVRPRRAWR